MKCITWFSLKWPLHYNELAQRSLCMWRHFDIRLHMLACFEGRLLNGNQRFKVVYSSLMTFPYVGVCTGHQRFLCMHKKV